MARYSNVTTNFSGGLITDNLAGRKDIERVSNSCRKLSNFFPSLQGPTTYRQGFQLSYVDATETDTEFRQVHLTIGKDESYRLVFTNQKLRVFDINGVLKYTWVTPYIATQLNDLRFSSETSIIYICHPNHRPRKFEVIGTTSYFNEISTYIEPFLQEEETDTKIDITKGEEVAKVESTNSDFQNIYDDYSKLTAKSIGAANSSRTAGTYSGVANSGVASTSSGSGTGATFNVVVDGNGAATVIAVANGSGYVVDEVITIADSVLGNGGAPNLTFNVASLPNSFSKVWYVEYQVNDIWLLGAVIDSSTNYPTVVGPTSNVVYVDQVDFVTELNDPSAKFYLADNHITTAASSDSKKLIKDGVPHGELHLRTDTDVFDSSQIGTWIRVSAESSSSDVIVDSSSSMTRWVKIASYEGTEAHPVDFERGEIATNASAFYEYGSVYKSFGEASFDVLTSANASSTSTVASILPAGQRTFVWSGGTFTVATNGTTVDDVVGNLSTAIEVDVHKVDTTASDVHSATFNGASANLIQPSGAISVSEIANDVSVVATSGIFTSATALNRHLRGVMPSGVVHMQIVARTSDTEVRARLKNPVPRNAVTGLFENGGRFTTFSLGAWYTNNYPADVVFFERRRVYGGTPSHPNYVFFSQLDDETSFAPSEDDKTVLDTNGISYPLSNVNSSVRWMIAA